RRATGSIGQRCSARRAALPFASSERCLSDAPPHPWRDELAAPDAALCHSRDRLFPDIVRRVVPIGECPALRYYPGVEILAAETADGDDAAVAVGVAGLANHVVLCNVSGESEGRRLAAAVSETVGSFA